MDYPVIIQLHVLTLMVEKIFNTATRTDTYGGEDIYKVSMSHPETENPSLLASIYNAAPNDLTSEVKYAAIPADEIREKRSSRENEVQTHITFAVNKEHEGSNTTDQALLQNVYFDNRKAKLKPGSFEYLNQVAAYMEEHREIKLELAGHTDDIGSASFNTDLSWERAGAVFQYLIRKGIEPSRMVMKGYGKAKPLATNDDEREGRELNRRVEFNILPSYNGHPLTGGSSYTSNPISL
jgi:outer membrane protein OmpA-like peptidoglycan-associated protein